MTPLTGGVSSDIWRVDLQPEPVCVKRALAKLKVAADWRAPVERNAYEADWITVARARRTVRRARAAGARPRRRRAGDALPRPGPLPAVEGR